MLDGVDQFNAIMHTDVRFFSRLVSTPTEFWLWDTMQLSGISFWKQLYGTFSDNWFFTFNTIHCHTRYCICHYPRRESCPGKSKCKELHLTSWNISHNFNGVVETIVYYYFLNTMPCKYLLIIQFIVNKEKHHLNKTVL